MPTFVAELEPVALWKQFDRILATPRPSKKEAAMRAVVEEVARARGSRRAPTRPATSSSRCPAARPRGRQDRRPAESPRHGHREELGRRARLRHAGDRAAPRGRLALRHRHHARRRQRHRRRRHAGGGRGRHDRPPAARAAVHGRGGDRLVGAAALDPALVSGRTLLNLDTEEEGALYVGCAGGAGSRARDPARRHVRRRRPRDARGQGLRPPGGHPAWTSTCSAATPSRCSCAALHPLWIEYQFELAR